jgi:hypothetical protein
MNKIHKFENGSYIVELTTKKSLEIENKLLKLEMDEFIDYYYNCYVDGGNRFFSLRDKNNNHLAKLEFNTHSKNRTKLENYDFYYNPTFNSAYNFKTPKLESISGLNSRLPSEDNLNLILEFINNNNYLIDFGSAFEEFYPIYPYKGKYKLFNSRKEYEEKMKYIYAKNDWSSFIGHIVDVKDMIWFKKAPNIELNAFLASNSGLESYPKNFKAKIVFQDKCKNARIAPNTKIELFSAIESGLGFYPENFRADAVDQTGCENAKIAPNTKLIRFTATSSGLTTYPDNFKSSYVDQNHCSKTKNAPNCNTINFNACYSGLEFYPNNFKADVVRQDYCKKSKIAPNCELKDFHAFASGLESYPDNFKADFVDQSFCFKSKVAPNCKVELFLTLGNELVTLPIDFIGTPKTNIIYNEKNINLKFNHMPNTEMLSWYSYHNTLIKNKDYTDKEAAKTLKDYLYSFILKNKK